jgi:hypothetical protein
MAESNRTHTAPSKDEIQRARDSIATDALCELALLSDDLLKFCHRLDDAEMYRLRSIAVRIHQLQGSILSMTVLQDYEEDELERAASMVYGEGLGGLDNDKTLATITADRATRETNREVSHA